MDPDRLVFPPALAVFGVVTIFALYASVLPIWAVMGVGSGQLFGYVCYDCIHYYLHHGEPNKSTFIGRHKAYHHAHHFKQPDLGRYGNSGQALAWRRLRHLVDGVGLGF
jgi:4-hydroxysphinganine ceramide fatty acyl 2-hydroxylase